MGVSQSMVVVENHDGGDHAGGHHEHDAVEVSSWGRQEIGLGWYRLKMYEKRMEFYFKLILQNQQRGSIHPKNTSYLTRKIKTKECHFPFFAVSTQFVIHSLKLMENMC